MLAFFNVRGGGEYGRSWHEAARKTRRQNAFDDFVAAARWLVAAGYTTPARLAARGNSNGGLLVAVSAMQAPGAFGAVFCRVPTLDMLHYPSLSLGGSALEYGAPTDPIEGAYLAGYSPSWSRGTPRWQAGHPHRRKRGQDWQEDRSHHGRAARLIRERARLASGPSNLYHDVQKVCDLVQWRFTAHRLSGSCR